MEWGEPSWFVDLNDAPQRERDWGGAVWLVVIGALCLVFGFLAVYGGYALVRDWPYLWR